LTIAVNSNATPTFTAVAAICSGDTLSALPTTSTNGIAGTWSPALNNLATTTYTFTPTTGQCAASTTLTIAVNSNATPTFTAVAAICSGDTLSALPTTSTNGIAGTWSPALNNLATTTYTFTPTAGQCAALTTLTIVVNNSVVPNFPSVINLCNGEAAPILENVSPNGISGSWTPSVISTTANQEYTFAPNPEQCAQAFTLAVQVSSIAFSIGNKCVDGDYYLEATSTTNEFTYEWTNKDEVIVGTDSDLNVTELLASNSNTAYPVTLNLTVRNTEGCALTKSELVYNIFCRIPKGISPNNDDKNDAFDLTGLGVKEIAIFNRYGTEVYHRKNYTNQWNGVSNGGMELPDGTYFYVIDNGSGKNITGWVYVIR
jgi:gliding motility-associated-like protein